MADLEVDFDLVLAGFLGAETVVTAGLVSTFLLEEETFFTVAFLTAVFLGVATFSFLLAAVEILVTTFAALTLLVAVAAFLVVVFFLTVFGLLGATSFLATVFFLAVFGLLGATAFLVTAFFLAVFGLLGATAFLATVAFLGAAFTFFGVEFFLAVFALDFLTIWFTNNSLVHCDEQ
ncbi:hypothetical protein OAH07_00700 [Verrucomicrobia bacterium]|nr:hypothetical protein [Verrucomicrobiota bacterium]